MWFALWSLLLAADSSAADPDPCLAPANPIVAENCRPGTPVGQWGRTDDSGLRGFTDDISYAPGGTVTLRVAAAAPYSIEVFRLGYYQGLGARRVATLAPQGAKAQPACLFVSATRLVDCGNWDATGSWTVPSDAVSGIYILRLARTDTGGSIHIPFVVRDDSGASDVLMQTSDTTWHAYGVVDGFSLYVGSPTRAYKVSYNRPFLPTDMYKYEVPLMRFLEANGFSVSYFTGVDTDRRGQLLLTHKAFISVGHDEYWSGTQRANVEAARDAGVHLLFLTGNGVFWKTRWEASIDGAGRPHRTLVTYKETTANAKIDPSPQWTGLWRDGRFAGPPEGGRPENALMGTQFGVDARRNDPMIVDSTSGRLRFWRNTGVAALLPGQTTSFAELLGYEWDGDPDNGLRPPGLVRLSSSTYLVERRFESPFDFVAGPLTHHLTLYRHSSGALVFGAGTMQWPWGLEVRPGGGTPPQTALRQATVNLLADMGIQPATLQNGLSPASASTDVVPPSSAVTAPPSGSSATVGNLVLVQGTAADEGGVIGGVEVSTDDGATWRPASGQESWTYAWTPERPGTFSLRSRAVDDSLGLETPGAGITVVVSSSAAPVPEPLVQDTFSGPDGLITNEYATYNPSDPNSVKSSTWEVTSGSLFNEDGEGWSGVPDAVSPNATSSNGTHSAVFRAVARRNDLRDVAVSFFLTTVRLVTTSATPSASSDGVQAVVRYLGNATCYVAWINRRDNTVVVKKKLNNAYTTLGSAAFGWTAGAEQFVRLSAKNEADGSVRLELSVDGRALLSLRDASNPIVAAGRAGLWATNAEFKFDDFTAAPLTAPPPPPPAPGISELRPSSATAGNAGFTLTVLGAGFSPDSIVRWNGADRATTFVGASTLTALVPSSDLPAPTTAQVTVFRPGAGASSPVPFVVHPATAPPPPPGNALLFEPFSRPDGLITNEYATYNPTDPSSVRSSTWEVTSGSLFNKDGEGWTGVPDDRVPNATSTNGTHSAVFRLVTRRADFQEVALTLSLKTLRLVSTPSTPALAGDGVQLVARYQSSSTFYIAWLNRRDGAVVLKKRRNGTYSTLATASQAWAPGVPQAVRLRVQGEPDGAVRIELDIDARPVLSFRDASNPITAAGRTGLWATNAEFTFDDFRVEALAGGSVAAGFSPPPPAPPLPRVEPGPGPNPWRGDRHRGLPVVFRGLPAGASVRLFDTAGRPVGSMTERGGSAAWGLSSPDGRSIGSGFYVYVILAPGGRVKRGVVGVIR